jgi:hypothetical protein
MDGRHRKPVRRFWRVDAIRPSISNLVWSWCWVFWWVFLARTDDGSSQVATWITRVFLAVQLAATAFLTVRWDYVRRENRARENPSQAGTPPRRRF